MKIKEASWAEKEQGLKQPKPGCPAWKFFGGNVSLSEITAEGSHPQSPGVGRTQKGSSLEECLQSGDTWKGLRHTGSQGSFVGRAVGFGGVKYESVMLASDFYFMQEVRFLEISRIYS